MSLTEKSKVPFQKSPILYNSVKDAKIVDKPAPISSAKNQKQQIQSAENIKNSKILNEKTSEKKDKLQKKAINLEKERKVKSGSVDLKKSPVKQPNEKSIDKILEDKAPNVILMKSTSIKDKAGIINTSYQSIRTQSATGNNKKKDIFRSKKLDLDFSVFKFKPAVLLLQSNAFGKKYQPKDIKPSFQDLSDAEKEAYKALYLEIAHLNENQSQFTVRRFKNFLSPYYTIFKEMNLSLDTNKPKRNVLIRLKELFEAEQHDSSIVYYNGPASKTGGLIIESKDFGEEELFLKDVLEEWKKKASQQKHLLIILESNYSGKWVKELNELKLPDVSILAACREKEKTSTCKIGGLFMHNFLKYLTKNQNENITPPTEASPNFSGDYMKCKQYTNLFLNFKDWDSIIAIQKSEFGKITYENGVYIGHIARASKHFWGNFRWTSGIFKDSQYFGEFHNGQLQGKGIMMYKNGRVYAGGFVNNAHEGLGEEWYDNKDFYVGKYHKGFKSGQGVYTYANGDVYKGDFSENKPNGRGKLTMKNGCLYSGQFKSGKCEGKGTYKYKNGDVYVGEWCASLKHGKGKYSYVNGDVYEGDFINGVRHGYGIFKSKTGEMYKGNWEMDMKSGEGECVNEYCKTTGEWVKGNITKSPIFFTKMGSKQIEAKLV